jgi:hypothetical protein
MEHTPCRSQSSTPIVPTKRCFGKGVFAWRESPVPDDGCRAASGGKGLVLSSSTVSRGVVLLERDEVGERYTVEVDADIALARCSRCGTRPRVLPYDVLPRRRYSLAVVSDQVTTYAKGCSSLRAVVWSLLGERTPSHTTLHGWTEGLGAHALGLPGGEAGGWPFSRFLAEAEARVPAVRAVWEAEAWVDERRYRSPERRERLSAVARVMAVAQTLTGHRAPDSLAECRRLTLGWSGSCGLGFPSRFSCTAIEQRYRRDRAGLGHPEPPSPQRCPIRTRSPPGGSSRSPR